MIIDWTKGALDQYTFSGWPAIWNWSAIRSGVVLGPYCVEAGEVFAAGSSLGEVFVAGAEIGEGGCD